MKIFKKVFHFIFKKINSHIKYQLFFSYVLIGIVLLSILGGALFYIFSKTLTEKYYQYMEQLNEQIILNLEKNIYDLEQVSFTVNYEDSLNNMMRANSENLDLYNRNYLTAYQTINNYFFNLIGTKKEIRGLYIYTLNGENSYAINKDTKGHLNRRVNLELWFKEALKRRGRSLLLGLHTNQFLKDDPTQVISVARAIIDNERNNFIGVILVDQDVKYIGNIINNIKIGEKGTVIIIDEDNKLVYSNNDEMYQNVSRQHEFYLNTKKSQNLSYTFGKGSNKIFVIQNVSEHTQWKIITCTTYSDLMKDSLLIRNIMASIMLICLLFTFIVSVYISGKATDSLIQMEKLIEQVEKGNLDVQIAITGSNEVARLENGFNSMIARIRNLIEDEYHEKLLRKEAELNLLQTQINPHFLYNTLGSIKNMANTEGAGTTARMIQSLSRIFRYNLSNTGKIVTIRDEIEHIKNYLLLQEYRHQDKIKVSYDLEEVVLNEKIMVTSLQPIVENAIVHGLEPKQGEGRIHIIVKHIEGYTKIFVTDDGVGMNENKINELNRELNEDHDKIVNFNDQLKQSRIGIFNVNSRIKHRFGKEYGIHIKSNRDAGITVELVLPQINHSHNEEVKQANV